MVRQIIVVACLVAAGCTEKTAGSKAKEAGAMVEADDPNFTVKLASGWERAKGWEYLNPAFPKEQIVIAFEELKEPAKPEQMEQVVRDAANARFDALRSNAQTLDSISVEPPAKVATGWAVRGQGKSVKQPVTFYFRVLGDETRVLTVSAVSSSAPTSPTFQARVKEVLDSMVLKPHAH